MFCKNLKKARKKAGLSQEAVAELICTSRSNISKYETGTLEPNIETIRKLCKIYNVSADELLEIKETGKRIENNISINQGNNGKATVNINNK